MKAIKVHEFGAPGVMQLVNDCSVPAPLNGQVLVKVHSSGVNPVDTYIRAGIYKAKPTLPYTPGSDGAGVIEKSGQDTAFKKGDRVYFRNALTGSYAQYVVVKQENVYALNNNLTFQEGAAIGIPYFTAYRALVQKCQPKPGQSVLIHGATGAVGIAACQIGRVLGLKVYGTGGTDDGMKLVLKNGAHYAFNHKEAGYKDHIMEATGNKGFDNILEMLANVNLEADLEMAAVGGKIAVIGSRATAEITPRHAMAKELSIHGVMMGQAPQQDINEAAAFFAQGQESGWLRPHVGEQFSMNDVAKAHEQVIAHTGGSKGKLVLNIDL